MNCKICNRKIGSVYSRQIYLERRPTEDYCIECFEKLMPEYDKLVERMRGCITKEQTKNESDSIIAFLELKKEHPD